MRRFSVFAISAFMLILSLTACGNEEEKKPGLEKITPFDVISYMKAHPPIDTSKVKITRNFDNLIKVKTIEKKLFDKWLERHLSSPDTGILNIWSKFGILIDAISLEFKIIEFLELNPRIIFFKKEIFYRELNIPFTSFSNADPFYQLVQKHLLFAADLLKHYSREEIEEKLKNWFDKRQELNDEDREALSFDLLRWYRLEENGILRHPADSAKASLKN